MNKQTVKKDSPFCASKVYVLPPLNLVIWVRAILAEQILARILLVASNFSGVAKSRDKNE
jgi:hypothetical protein